MVPLRLLLPFALGYFLGYLFRVVNAVAGPGISADFGIDPAELGFLTSVYFLTYAAVQLPLGVLLDRFKPNHVGAALMLVAAAGSAIFAIGADLLTLSVGRALIGIGVSACLMSAFKAYSANLKAEQLPLANGFQMALGSLGVFAGGLPTEIAMEAIGWRGLFGILALLSLACAAALIFVVPQIARPQSTGDSLAAQFREVGHVLVSKPFVRLAPLSVMGHVTMMSMQALWAGAWLRDVAGRSPAGAATILSLMAVGMVLGYLLVGTGTTRLVRRGVPIGTVLIAGTLAYMAVQLGIMLIAPEKAVLLWPIFALLATSLSLAYPALGALYPGALTGRVHTALNFLIFVVTFVAQWGFGVLVEWLRPAYGAEAAYDLGLGVLLAAQAAGFGWYILRRPRADPAPALSAERHRLT